MKAKTIVLVLVAIIVIGGAWKLFSKKGDKVETLTVHPAPFLQQVSVSGTVVAQQEVELGFTQSGRIASVAAKVGDHVQRGALIASLENGDLAAAVAQKEAQVGKAQADLAQLLAGTRSEDVAVSTAQLRSDETAEIQARESIVNALRDAYTKADDAVHNKIDQFLDNPRGDNPQLRFQTVDVQYEVAFYAKRKTIERMLTAWATDAGALTSESNLAQAAAATQAHLADTLSLLNDANTLLSRAQATQTVTQATLSGWTSDVATARTNMNTTIAAVTSAVTVEKSAATKVETSKRALELKRAGATPEDIDAQKALIASAQADLQSARAQLAKTIILAPFAGTVTRMDDKVGAIASPGNSQIAMMSDGILQIESYVPEINVALISVGDKASITLDAYGESVVFPATIIAIDPARTLRDGVSTFKTTLAFEKIDSRLRSGMTSNVVVTTEEKNAVIAIPQRLVIDRDGKKHVVVHVGEKTEEREVATGGVSTLGTVEITSGLKDGDVVEIKN